MWGWGVLALWGAALALQTGLTGSREPVMIANAYCSCQSSAEAGRCWYQCVMWEMYSPVRRVMGQRCNCGAGVRMTARLWL